ncbi:MAG: GMC family oxidoreductase [Hyphomonadaceae bacterium]|nr:GMC family oxidoreductase [Hyphomonadaceae bacterium]
MSFDFDAIVVGSGMSGGWVAKELCERGLKVAVIERGRNTDPTEDYKDHVDPWDTPNMGKKTPEDLKKHPIQSEVYAFNQNTKQFWVDDNDHPYITPEDQDYKWRRGYHKGGRSIMWGRQSYRMSEIDFEANKKDNIGVDWPVRYDDIKPWYDHVERFAGISGSMEGLDILPDGVFQPPFEFTCAEEVFKEKVEEKFPGRKVIPGRAAHLTAPTQEQMDLGRGKCQSRALCERGCSFGAYFSSVSATLPAAERTGNMTLIADTAVQKLDYNSETGKISGVQTVNTKTKEKKTLSARTVFLNAGTIPTTMILLNSANEHFPNGLANSSGHLGKNLMDHVACGRGWGIMPGMMDKYHKGRRPNGFYIPRFRNHTEVGEGFIRGYGYQGRIYRNSGWSINNPGIGSSYKKANRTPNPWALSLIAFAEILPDERNQITLHPSKTDQWGFPVPVIDAKMRENEVNLIKQATRDTIAMMDAAGIVMPDADDPEDPHINAPGNGIHEMGTARMGHDSADSVLNKFNQSWDIPNLFVTDGSFMTSGGCQNPSLTYMAFSARAADHAVKLMKENKI